MNIKPLLVRAGDHEPYLPNGLPFLEAAKGPRPERVDPGTLGPNDPSSFIDDGASPNDLRCQRWGVVVPEEGGDELFARIRPLVDLRQQEQGDEIRGDAPGRPFK